MGLLLGRFLARSGRRSFGAERPRFSGRLRQDDGRDQAAGNEAGSVDRQRTGRRLDDLGHPAVKNARTRSGGLCRASDVVSRLYLEGFTRQIRENGVRLLKFDNLLDRCDEPGHDHLPGDYSTEPICNHIIQLYSDLDRLCPDVMIMLYWRYQSPWWLERADTLFDIGTKIEAASFAPWPTFRARDSVTRRLDEARWMVKDIPTVGWDPLGIWLSDWPWNSCVARRHGKRVW